MKLGYFLTIVALLTFSGCGGGSSSDQINSGTNDGSGGVTSDNSGSSSFMVPTLEESVKIEFLDAINTARSSRQDCGSEGVHEATHDLIWNDNLYKAAYEHSYDLAESDTFDHNGSGTEYDITAQELNLGSGSTFKERIERNGYTNWSTIGENITAGTIIDEAHEAIDAWLASDEHCANLMNPNYTEVGMAHYSKARSTYTNYWTQNFGKPR